MIKSFLGYQHLSEERKNADINQKQSAWVFLQQYIRFEDEHQTIVIKKGGKELRFEAEDVFIHFGSQFKVGVNPQSKYDTPNGIYTYNLKNVWDYYDLYQSPMSKLPFAGQQPYIWVCVYNGKGKFVSDMADFSEEQYDKAIPILRKIWKSFSHDDFEEMQIEAEDSAHYGDPISKFWNLTRLMAREATHARGGEVPDDEHDTVRGLYNRPALLWNKILRECGYIGFNDNGQGYIFSDEPMQAVFLQKDALDVIDVIHNKYFHDGANKENLAFLNKNKIKVDTENIGELTKRMNLEAKWMLDVKIWTGALKCSLSKVGGLITLVGATPSTTLNRCTLEDIDKASFHRMTFMNSTLSGELHPNGETKMTAQIRECSLEKCNVKNMYVSYNGRTDVKDNTFEHCIIVDPTGDVQLYNKLIDCTVREV